jgi:hypothetical protein
LCSPRPNPGRPGVQDPPQLPPSLSPLLCAPARNQGAAQLCPACVLRCVCARAQAPPPPSPPQPQVQLDFFAYCAGEGPGGCLAPPCGGSEPPPAQVRVPAGKLTRGALTRSCRHAGVLREPRVKKARYGASQNADPPNRVEPSSNLVSKGRGKGRKASRWPPYSAGHCYRSVLVWRSKGGPRPKSRFNKPHTPFTPSRGPGNRASSRQAFDPLFTRQPTSEAFRYRGLGGGRGPERQQLRAAEPSFTPPYRKQACPGPPLPLWEGESYAQFLAGGSSHPGSLYPRVALRGSSPRRSC